MLKIADKINRVVLYVTIALFAVSFTIIALQVFLRYLFSYGLAWGEELARYLNILVVLLGSSAIVFEGSHPRIETLYDALPDRFQRWMSAIFTLLTSIFLILLIWQGISLCVFAWEDYTSSLRVRWTIPYICIPLGGLLMLIQLGLRFIQDRKNSRTNRHSTSRL